LGGGGDILTFSWGEKGRGVLIIDDVEKDKKKKEEFGGNKENLKSRSSQGWGVSWWVSGRLLSRAVVFQNEDIVEKSKDRKRKMVM